MCIGMDHVEETTRNLLVFHSSGLECAFPLEAVREVVSMASLWSPPGLPAALAGFLDLRGTAIPIVRLDRLFHLPEQQPGWYTPLIILRGVDMPIGILAGAVRQIVRANLTSFVPLPEKHVLHDCATASVEIEGGVVHLLSAELILIENERRLLSELQAAAQERMQDMEARL